MATPTEDEILESVVAIQNTITGIGRVHDRIRLPTTDAEFVELCVDDNQLINAVFIRPVAFGPEALSTFNDYNGEILTIEFIFMFGYAVAIPALSDIASEREFYRILFDTKNAFKASTNLGFDPGASHSGFRTASDIPPPQVQGDYMVHYATCRLSISIGEC